MYAYQTLPTDEQQSQRRREKVNEESLEPEQKAWGFFCSQAFFPPTASRWHALAKQNPYEKISRSEVKLAVEQRSKNDSPTDYD